MLKHYPDELICDLAETYHILDYKRLPLRRVAVFACGLREESRVMKELNQHPLTLDQMISAARFDQMSQLMYGLSSSKKNTMKRPKSLLDQLTGKNKKQPSGSAFTSGKDFDERRQLLIEQIERGA